MPASEFAEWQYDYQQRLFGLERIELLLIQLTTLYANAHLKKNASKLTFEDFRLKLGNDDKLPATADDWLRNQDMLYESLGGKLDE